MKKSKMTFEAPPLTVLIKVASIVVHAEELLSEKGDALDLEAMRPLLRDPEIRQWIKTAGVYVPLKR
jgi:hypothetical protein